MIGADFSSLLVSIAIIAALGRRVGPIAGALSLVGGVATFTVIGMWRLRSRLGVRWRALLPWPSMLAAMVIAGVTGVPARLRLLSAPPIVTLLLGGFVASLAYAALVWRVGLVGPSERVLVMRWLERAGLARIAVVWPAGRSWLGDAAVQGANGSGSR
jgi:NO-binding membrane sensor protein with MHYT domain